MESNLSDIIITFMLAFIITYILVPFSMRIAFKIGAIDVPNEKRKIHKKATPRFGGAAIISGFVIATLFTAITVYIKGRLNLTPEEFIRLCRNVCRGRNNIRNWSY